MRVFHGAFRYLYAYTLIVGSVYQYFWLIFPFRHLKPFLASRFLFWPLVTLQTEIIFASFVIHSL